jgi:hypothetical protein
MTTGWTFGTYTAEMAEDYFSTHIKKSLWDAYDTETQELAVNQAEREIWAFLGGMYLNHPNDILPYSRYRQDYAIYEQALYCLQISGINRTGELNGAQWTQNDEEDSVEVADYPPAPICKEAKFWLTVKTRTPRLGRG